jgi:hypothetical protein
MLFWTEPDGTFEIPGCPPGKRIELWAFLPREWTFAVSRDGAPVQPAIPIASLTTKSDGPTELGEVKIETLTTVDVQCMMPDGAPAERPLVGLAIPGWDFEAPVGRADRLGRARWLVPQGTEALVGGLHAGAFGSIRADGEMRLRVDLEELPVVAG